MKLSHFKVIAILLIPLFSLQAQVNTIYSFINSARFLPNNPTDMTADDCTWFSNNSWKLNYRFVFDNVILSAKQEEIYRHEMDANFKTFNYLVYTKPFAIYLQKAFEENKFVAINTNPSETPTPLAILLAYRGLSSDNFKDKELKIRLYNSASTPWTSEVDGKSNFNLASQNFTIADITAGRWDFHASNPNSLKQINIPFNSFSSSTYFAENFVCGGASSGRFPGNLFDLNLNFIALAETLWGWGHPSETNGKDLAYSIGAIAGDLIWGWGDAKLILKEIPVVTLAQRIPMIESALGGHLPMALNCWQWPYWGNYTLNMQYSAHKLSKVIHPVSLPTSGLGTQNLSLPKSIPSDPFECIRWNLNYNALSILDNNSEAYLEKTTVYPNPIKKNVFIQTPKEVKIISLSITNLAGKQLKNFSYKQISDTFVEASLNISSGLYIIKIETNKGSVNKKVIVE